MACRSKIRENTIICYCSINCYNNSEQDVTCKIENIKVEFLKKNKLSEGILISENDAMKIIQASTTLVVNSALIFSILQVTSCSELL